MTVTLTTVLTNTSDHQQLPKEEQQICDFIQDNYPAVEGRAAWGKGPDRAGNSDIYPRFKMVTAEPWTKDGTLLSRVGP